MNTNEAKKQDDGSNGTGRNRWAGAPGVGAFHHAVQKVQTAILDGAGAEWVRVTTDRDADKTTLIVELIGGDEEKARGFIDAMLPADVAYEITKPSFQVRVMVRATRGAAKLNQRGQSVYRGLMLKAIRAIGGTFNPKA